MKSFVIGRIEGIQVELHSTFVFFILFLFGLLAVFDPVNLLGSITLIVFLFTSVFFHELSHSIVSISKRIKVKKIILLPIGGMALTDNFPDKPIDEFLISIAGPLFNFAVVIVLVILVSLFDFIPFPWDFIENRLNLDFSLMHYPVFALMYVNLILGTFNLLLPALPLDGGRVWRSLLAMKFGKTNATKFVSMISKIIALILFVFAVFFGGGIILAIIAVFIYFASKYENDLQQMKSILTGITLKSIIKEEIPLLQKNLNLKELFDLMQEENVFAFVIKEKQLKYIDLELIKKVNQKNWGKTKASEISVVLPLIPVSAKAEKAMELFMATNFELIGVHSNGKLAGVIEKKEMQELFELAKAKKKKNKDSRTETVPAV
ncbi:MAG: hypothetical protein COT90_00675 [Candidatus Diapherotrites archaeon CG10_big_fil_rev_8_21_14_0_10_31_34]|nr:MAG: hypothetical protein COT90_00675 [Candidatus Diapherotrites archaeon CG10_big_fil_rev_8_21_14_0_10_31_34]